MKEKILQDLGLTRNEAKILLTLYKLGSSTAGGLTENSGIHRRNVYDSIERLMEKGLVSFVIENNVKLFNPANPNKLLHILDEKKKGLEKIRNQVKNILPELDFVREEKHDVRYFRGPEGLKTVYEDILRTGKDYVGYGPAEQMEEVLKYYIPNYVKRRVKQKISIKLIYPENLRGSPFSKATLGKIKYMPDEYTSHTSLRVYGHKVAIILFSEDTPVAIVINNEKISDSYRKYFNFLWKHARD